jgi:hypothetical protein
MDKRAGNACYTILSILTMSASLAFTLIGLIFLGKLTLQNVAPGVLMYLVVVFWVTAILFVYSIYASIWGDKRLQAILSVLFVFFGIFLFINAALLFGWKSLMKKSLGDLWADPDSVGVAGAIQKYLSCRCWDSSNDSAVIINPPGCHREEGERYCNVVWDDFYKMWATFLGVGLITIGVVLVLGPVVLMRVRLAPRDEREVDSKAIELSAPLNGDRAVTDEF